MQGAEAVLPHQSLNPVLAARLSSPTKIQEDSRCTIDALASNERGANQPD